MAGDFLPPDASPADGRIDVLMWRNPFAIAGTALGWSRPSHIASAGEVALTLDAGQFMEVDGEPWQLDVGCDLLVRHHRQVTMLCAPFDASSRSAARRRFWHPAGVDEG